MDKDSRVDLRMTPAEKESWTAAAQRENLSLSAWIRTTLSHEALRGAPTQEALRQAHDAEEQGRFKDLCGRCTRIGHPSCDPCRAANPDYVHL